jgi:ADP-ribose pyrophosphatase
MATDTIKGLGQFGHDDVQLLEKKTAFRGFFEIQTLTLKHRLFAGGWSGEIERELFERGDAVGVLLYDPDRDEIALVEQFRIGAYMRGDKPWLLELVAGMVGKGESLQEVAERECMEEAACVLQALEPIAGYYSSPGGSSEYLSLFCGRVSMDGVGGIHGLDEESEDIRVHVMPSAQAMVMLDKGELNNAQILIALQWLQLHKERIDLKWKHPNQKN